MKYNKCITHTSLTLHVFSGNREGLGCIHKNRVIKGELLYRLWSSTTSRASMPPLTT